MTTSQFLIELEGYYGPYPVERPKARAYVELYLRDNYSDKGRLELWRRLRVEVSGRFRATPDIADLEAVRRRIDSEPRYPALSWDGDTPSDEEREEITASLAGLRAKLAGKEKTA